MTNKQRAMLEEAEILLQYIPKSLLSFLERADRIELNASAPAPDLAPVAAQFVERVYSNQAGGRAYKLYIPSGRRDHALPLVVMLHGCTQTPDDFAAGTRMNALAEEGGFFVAYPEQAVSANPSKCWNWFTPANQQRNSGEPSLIAGITRQILSDYSVDSQRIYVAGLSAGAAAAAIMGMTYPDLYAAIGVHSGLARGAASDLPSALAAIRQRQPVAINAPSGAPDAPKGQRVVPTIVFHGDQDVTVHAHNGDLVIAQSRTMTTTPLHTHVEYGRAPRGHAYSRTVHANTNGQSILEQWVIHEGGHAWSGGSPASSYTDPRGPDAAQEMLRFFLGHSMLPLVH